MAPRQRRVFGAIVTAKCRQAVQLLQDMGLEPEIVEYLNEIPSVEEIESFIRMSDTDPGQFIRPKDAKDGCIENLDVTDIRAVAEAIHAQPGMLQRPVVVHRGRSVIARPAELLKSLIQKN